MRVNEIFYSIQGEGYYTGTPAVFIRLSGCNLKCDFCDTNHQPFAEMTEEEIVSRVRPCPARLVVITGGEPALQLTKSMVSLLHEAGKYVAVETNGTKELPKNVDWITVSPKESYVGTAGKVTIKKASEVKVVMRYDKQIADPTFGIDATYYYVQPCDLYDEEKNRKSIQACLDFVKENPTWKISLQTQKILNVQ